MVKLAYVALVVAVMVVLVYAALYGGQKRQSYYDSVNHPVYSTSVINNGGN